MKNISWLVALAVVLIAPIGTAAQRPKCFPREGRCVTVVVNGQAPVKLGKQTRKFLEPLRKNNHLRYWLNDTFYEVETPIRGEIDVKATAAAGSAYWYGAVRDVEISVVPLQHLELDTHRELSTADNVRVGGDAAVTQQEVLNSNRLPPGKYLLVVQVDGEQNWDRQVLFLEVQP